jgi:mannose-1-phosphate guanylyltransferase
VITPDTALLDRRGDTLAESPSRSRWALILAGGDGLRLRPLTRRIAGDERPKQFCRVLSRETLVQQTLRRAAMLVSPERILAAVVRTHERFYAPFLADIASRCMLIQPENRGNAPAILYGLLRLLTLAPVGPVAIFPSDHYVSDDQAFMAHVEGAFDVVLARPDLVVLLGIAPDTDEVDYGWIEPTDLIPGPWPWPVFRVRGFWEKPSRAIAETLRARGCLWNSFVMVAYPSALLALMRRAVPALVEAFAAVDPRPNTLWEHDDLRRLYSRLPSTDFSQQVLARCPANLAVLPLNGIGWNDLGEPRRVMATLGRTGMHPEWVRELLPA